MGDRVPTPTQRVALVVQYLGHPFYGWQRQPHHRTVQEEVETAIAKVLGYPVTIHAAGRTDTGVHAAAQVVHVDVNSPIPAHKWAVVLNNTLPEGILIRASAPVSFDWHARFTATWRRYRYLLYTAARPNLFVEPFVWHYYHEPIDEQRIRAALTPPPRSSPFVCVSPRRVLSPPFLGGGSRGLVPATGADGLPRSPSQWLSLWHDAFTGGNVGASGDRTAIAR